MSSESYRTRRARLFELMPPGSEVVLHNGYAPPRNVPSSHYPFRGASTFQFFCGPLPQGAVAVLTADRATLYLEPQSASDLVWDGPGESWESVGLAAAFDAVVDRKLLCVSGERVCAVPVLSTRGHSELERLLGRKVELRGADLRLVEAVIELRLVHDEFAQAELRSAVPPTVQAFAQARECSVPGGSEEKVVAALIGAATEQGVALSFPPIVSVRGEVLHNTVSKGLLKSGDLLLVDFGIESAAGYASDVTRTWPVSGKLSATQRDIYQLVLAAQGAAISAIRPRIEYRVVHEIACRKLIEGLITIGLLRGEPDSLFERGAHTIFFPHGIGHLIGLDVHDMEEFGDLAGYEPGRTRDARFGFNFLRLDRPLRAGMVVSIEPGIYFVPGLLDCRERRAEFGDCVNFDAVARFSDVRGIRIEDEVLVTRAGAEVLTLAIPSQVEA